MLATTAAAGTIIRYHLCLGKTQSLVASSQASSMQCMKYISWLETFLVEKSNRYNKRLLTLLPCLYRTFIFILCFLVNILINTTVRPVKSYSNILLRANMAMIFLDNDCGILFYRPQSKRYKVFHIYDDTTHVQSALCIYYPIDLLFRSWYYLEVSCIKLHTLAWNSRQWHLMRDGVHSECRLHLYPFILNFDSHCCS